MWLNGARKGRIGWIFYGSERSAGFLPPGVCAYQLHGIFVRLSHLLSKTSFLRGQQCPKALFLYKYYPHLRDPIPPDRLAIMRRGNDIGFLARQLFPGGEDATAGMGPRVPGSGQSRSVEAVGRTKELMDAGVNVIYEASFIYNDILVMIDILVRTETGWNMYEVKSSLRVSPTNVTDASLQFAVARGAGVFVENVFLVHLNGYYRRRGELNLKELFSVADITQDALEQEQRLMVAAEEQKLILGLPQAPTIEIGGRCFAPYECDFRGQCWKVTNDFSPFSLGGISKSEQSRLYEAGYTDFRNLPQAEIDQLPKMTTLQVRTAVKGETHIDKESIRSFIQSLGSEMLFVDVESFQPAIPRYEGTSPFMQLPFSFSSHRLLPGGKIDHYVFVAEPGIDPRKEFLEEFLKATEGTCPILSYDLSAEAQVLKLLRKVYADRRDEIDQRLSRMVDLMKPFAEGWYHSPEMKGSISLKYVLPALAPELSHSNLAIRNGSHAMTIYDGLEKENDLFARAEKIDALKEYCTLDTWGMVRIYEVLRTVSGFQVIG